MTDHAHEYARVPKLAGSWIACIHCGKPWLRSHKRADLINQIVALEQRVKEDSDLLRKWSLTAAERLDRIETLQRRVKRLEGAGRAVIENAFTDDPGSTFAKTDVVIGELRKAIAEKA